MRDSAEYHGREHTLLKHRVLQEYLVAWALKLGSTLGPGGGELWYVDSFAGPWRAASETLTDTSIHVSLEALRSAYVALARQGKRVKMGAIFIEKDPKSYAELESYLRSWKGPVEPHSFRGEFGEHATEIEALLRDSPALLFVDPTGIKGADMDLIRRLTCHPRRDVLVNVMASFITRFRKKFSLIEFFGLKKVTELPDDEEERMAFYRKQLKEVCKLPYAAELLVPHPTDQRVKYRLVVGGHHSAALQLFRDVEKKVLGREAATLRSEARERQYGARSGQMSLDFGALDEIDSVYEEVRAAGIDSVRRELSETLKGRGAILYRDLWPEILERHHITRTDLGRELWKMSKEGTLRVDGVLEGERSMKDEHSISVAGEKP